MPPSAGPSLTSMRQHDHRSRENAGLRMALALQVKRWCAMHEHWLKNMMWSAPQRSRRTLQPAGLFSTNIPHVRQRQQRTETGERTARTVHRQPRVIALARAVLELLQPSDP